MNTVYTIGRDPSCDIVIPDNTDVVSRVHASLKVKGGGKYILVDQSRNGTYVNGIKMSANEEIPVTRKDTISFAHVAELNWDMVPKEKPKGMLWGIIALVIVAVAGCILYFVLKPDDPKPVDPVGGETVPAEMTPDANVKNDTVRDTVFIKEKPRTKPEKPAKPKKDQPAAEEKPAEEEVIDAIY